VETRFGGPFDAACTLIQMSIAAASVFAENTFGRTRSTGKNYTALTSLRAELVAAALCHRVG
jgi:hypothetical protein